MFKLAVRSLAYNSLASWANIVDVLIQPLFWIIDHVVRYTGPVSWPASSGEGYFNHTFLSLDPDRPGVESSNEYTSSCVLILRPGLGSSTIGQVLKYFKYS